MIKIGITGGIGTGKSVVCKLLQQYGIEIYDADREAKRLTNQSSEIRRELTAIFGKHLYTNNILNRKELAEIIFNNANALETVNKIIHPAVAKDFLDFSKNQKGKYVAIESAILFESGFDKYVDSSLMIYSPLSTRIERAMLRDTETKENIEKRILNQLSEREKINRSSYIIFNDNGIALIPQIQNYLKYLAKYRYNPNLSQR